MYFFLLTTILSCIQPQQKKDNQRMKNEMKSKVSLIATSIESQTDDVLVLLRLENKTDSILDVYTPALIGISIKEQNGSFNFSKRIEVKPTGKVEIDANGIYEFELNLSKYFTLNGVTLQKGVYSGVFRYLINEDVINSNELIFETK